MTRARDLADLASSGVIEGTEVADDAITYSKIQNVSADERILGRVSGADGVIEELTKAQMLTMMNVADGSNAYTHPNHSGEVTSTADGATVIASNIVDEDNLKVSNSPTNGYALTAQSGNTGGMTWAEITTTLNGIDDTSSSNDDCVTITDNEVVINEDGDNQDFRVESDDQPNFFFCDASANIAGFSLHDRPDMGFVHITSASSGVSSVHAHADELVLEGSAHSGMSILSGTSSAGFINFGDSGDNNIGQIYYDHAQNDMYFAVHAGVVARLGTNGMRLGSSAGTPDTWCHIDGNSDESTGSLTMATPSRINMSNGATRDVINFGETSGYVRGKITHTHASGVTYNSSSDYRLKENEVSISNGIERIKQLKPYRFNWKETPSVTQDGFFAHEVSSIVPEAVNGTKDAMADKLRVVLDKDGNYLREGVLEENWEKGKLSGEFPSDSTWHATKEYPDHQQMDNARLVPLLTASLQEAITKIETLETANTDLATRITALENA